MSWFVDVARPGGGCAVLVRSAMAPLPPVISEATPGERWAVVHGQAALVTDRVYVAWNELSGARVTVSCLPGYDGILDLAESLAPVAPDDPRIPPGGG
jgi:hypothetical protein